MLPPPVYRVACSSRGERPRRGGLAPRVDVQQQHEAKRARVGNVALPTFMEMRDYIAEQLAPDTTDVTSLITVATTGWGVPVTDSTDRIKSIKEIYLTLIRAH